MIRLRLAKTVECVARELPGILTLFLIIFVLSTIAQAHGALPRLPDSLQVKETASEAQTEEIHSGLVNKGVPADYLDQILELQVVDPMNPAPLEVFGVDWLDKTEHQIAENPDGLNKTTALLTKIQQLGNIIAEFDGSNLFNVPIGIEGHFGDLPYLIGFDNIHLHTDYASVDVVASIYLPFLGDTLYFVAAGVKYNNRSGFIGGARLQLVQDFDVEINAQKSAVIFRGYRSESSRGSYLDIDCDGVKGINFGMDFTFHPGFITPVNSAQKFVRAYAEIAYNVESGFVANDLSIPLFYFKDFKEVAFSLQNLSVDFDESKTKIPFIQNYLNQVAATEGAVGISEEQWTGFHCQNFQLIIGNKYITNGTGKPVIIAGKNIVIDDLGFTVQLSVEKDLLTLDNGSIDGWAFSINQLNLGILANRLNRFGFGGLIHLPILDEKKDGPKEIADNDSETAVGPPTARTCLHYEANYLVDSSSLSLRVEKMDSNEFTVPMFFADISILPGSYLRLVTGENYRMEAYLNANLRFEGELGGGSKLQIPYIMFEGLYVSNRTPYLAVKRIHPAKKDSSNLGKFPFTFDEMALGDEEPIKYGGQLKKLSVTNLSLNFGEITSGDAFKVSSSLDILFGVKSEGSKQKWTGKGIRINEFGFEGTLPGIDCVKGELAFYRQHPIYGTGFSGAGSVRFAFLDAEVKMICQFGHTGDAGYNYSFVDAALDFDEPPVRDKTFAVHMLMAGYHKNMIREDATQFEVGDAMKISAGDTATILGGQFPGNRFMPSEGSWGIRGGIMAKIGEGAVMGVRILYEKHQSEQQGISSRFFFEGLVEIMPESDIRDSPTKNRIVDEGEAKDPLKEHAPMEFTSEGAFGGYIRIDVTRNSEGTTFDAALGVHGQLGPLGIQFYGEYYKSPDSWHLFIGTPVNRVGFTYGESLSDVVSASMGVFGYFMIGNSKMMPQELPPPYALSAGNANNLRIAYDSLRQNPSTNIFATGRTELDQGNAIAFGVGIGLQAAINIPDADRRWLFVSAGADIGFDLLLVRSKPECNLANVSKIGMNNWYVYGQMYAGISASVGFVIKNKMLKIFDGAACVLLTGAGFGPTWGLGTWRLQYQFLWKKGEAQGIFKYGQPCNNITSSFDPAKILEDIYPSRPIVHIDESVGESVVSINSDFKMDFAMPADRRSQQSLVDFEKGETESFYTHLVSDVTLLRPNGDYLQGDKLFDHDGRTLIFRPQEMLTPGERISLHLKSTVYDDRGIYSIDGQTFSVDTTLYYQVDPNGIFGLTTEDVAISYPMVDQHYFHKDEFDQMMLSYGKDLPLYPGLKLSSHLLVNNAGGYQEIEEGKFKPDKIGLIQGIFKSLEDGKNYQWVLRATSTAGKSADIASVNFSTSKFANFSDKARTVRISPLSLGNYQGDTTLSLAVSADEPLETFGGNVNTTFLANKNLANIPSPPVGNVKLIGARKQKVKSGKSYLSRFLSAFAKDGSYDYFREIYDRHIPYDSTIEINCTVDDGSPEDRIKAKPADAVQYHTMYAWTDKLLDFGSDTVRYDILRDFKHDHFEFMMAKPPVPIYYADCENYSKGTVPFYKPALYFIKLRYFIPGFEQYSATSTIVEFKIEN